MRCYIVRRRQCWKIFCLGALAYLFVIRRAVHSKIDQCKPSSTNRSIEVVRYIFDMTPWRELRLKDSSNRSLWCDVPKELKSISNAICRTYNMGDCKRLPCQMLYTSPGTLKDIKCRNGGQVFRTSDILQSEYQSSHQCKRGSTLDLFLNKFSSPSIIADLFTPFSKELYIDVLNSNFRTCNSIWGFVFNFESVTNYPWTADNHILKLFDVTYGYDRSIYDFIPAPWLFNYVEQLKFGTKRLSMHKALSTKKPIHSIKDPDIYWNSASTVSISKSMMKITVVRQ